MNIRRQRSKIEISGSDNDSFLKSFNAKIREKPPEELPAYPVLFSAGSPRSGTTILAQCLTSYFDVSFVDNIAARFWSAPWVGMRLSASLVPENWISSGTSDYGRTSGFDVHGFHFFWLEQLRISEPDDLFVSLKKRRVSLREITHAIAAMEQVRDRGMFFKGYYPAYFMSEFLAEIPGSLFVIIERDPVDQCMSILEARRRNHKCVEKWWSMVPPNYRELQELEPICQVAGQVLGLKKHFDNQAAKAGANARIVKVSYENLIDDPRGVMDHIGKAFQDYMKTRLPVRGNLPKIRKSASGKNEEALRQAIFQALAKSKSHEDCGND